MTIDDLVREASPDETTFRSRHPEPALVFLVSLRLPSPEPDDDRTRRLPAATKLQTDRAPDLSRKTTMAETHGDATPTRSEGCLVSESEVAFLQKTGRNPFAAMITVGRAPNNDIWIPITSVSKMHAYFSRDGESWRLTDQKSSNGTHVNGNALPSGGTVVLTPELRKLRFGPDVTALFYTPEGLFRLIQQFAAPSTKGAPARSGSDRPS